MTVNSLFNGLIGNAFYGGIATLIIIAAMFWKANKVSSTGSKAKMISWSIASSIMVIVAVMTHAIAVSIIWPKIQGAFTSTPVQNLVATGDALTSSIDNVLWSNGSGGEMQAMPVGPDAFKAPMQEASVNNGQTATFAGQPTNLADSYQKQVMTSNQAVQAVQALDATPTPVGGGQAYINTFIASQTGGSTYTVKRGDSLSAIANKLGISVKDLCAANAATIKNCNVISVGANLLIPKGQSPDSITFGALEDQAKVVQTVPSSFGQQSSTYNVQPTAQKAQPQAAVQRNVNNGQVVVNTNLQAVQAVQALAPAAPVVAAIPTPRDAFVLQEVLANAQKPTGGQAYIDQFLKQQTSEEVASAGQ